MGERYNFYAGSDYFDRRLPDQSGVCGRHAQKYVHSSVIISQIVEWKAGSDRIAGGYFRSVLYCDYADCRSLCRTSRQKCTGAGQRFGPDDRAFDWGLYCGSSHYHSM